MDEQLVRELIDLVESVSSTVWAAALRESYVRGILNVMGFIVSVIVILVLFKVGKYSYLKSKEEDDWDGIVALMSAGILIACIAAIATAFTAVPYFLNPEFRAIETLLRLVS